MTCFCQALTITWHALPSILILQADKIQETVNREERVKVYVMMDTLRIKYSDLLSELADLDEVAERDQVTVRGRITSGRFLH